MLDKAKSEFEGVKRAVDELRASEVLNSGSFLTDFVLLIIPHWCPSLGLYFANLQVDADFRLQDLKKAHKELELKLKGYRKKLDDLQVSLANHLEQYDSVAKLEVLAWISQKPDGYISLCRIHKDMVDPEKLQATLSDRSLTGACELQTALEMVALIEGQLKEMSPNLDSISE